MKNLYIAFILFMFLLGTGCGRQHPLIMNIEQEPIPASLDAKHYSLEDVELAILAACRKKGWSANTVEPGRIIASLTIRTRHRAKVEIRFTSAEYSILYMESSGLEYGDGRIHGNYNHWVAKLDAEVKKEFGLRTQRY